MAHLCVHCHRELRIAGEGAAYCPYCGKPLGDRPPVVVETRSPVDPEAPTQTAASPQLAGSGSPLPPPPSQIGKYRLLRALGRGGMGTVYEAEEGDTGRHVAVKLVASELSASPAAAERFRQEGRLASAINHPRCVFVQAADTEGQQPFIVMELMPGQTLKDLVERRGPLPLQEALDRILDVIEGLMEAHRLEVIHRDVKPSNCFLDRDGRVKVGDFGLAKSLIRPGSPHLTQSGTFLGTPFFASPEQVRGEPLDAQTDVYSVAATLYYLLTGKPPYSGNDTSSVLAKIVSENPKPMRWWRPDLPPAVDRVVLRGLHRDRRRRYASLAQFRDALLTLRPKELTLRGMGFRVAAYLIDHLVLVLGMVLLTAIVAAGVWLVDASPRLTMRQLVPAFNALAVFVWIGYFTVTEARWQCSLGKALLRLRVGSLEPGVPPPFSAVLMRSAVFALALHLGLLLSAGWELAAGLRGHPEQETGGPVLGGARLLIGLAWHVLGAGLLALGMRASDGFRGLHERISGTRVLQLPWPRRRPAPISSLGWFLYLKRLNLKRNLAAEPEPWDNLPSQIGNFTVQGKSRLAPQTYLLWAEDSSLARKVAILVRPEEAPALPAVRRDLARSTRPRWLAGGKLGRRQWDAFVAPPGCPLLDLIQSEGRLPWSEVRPILLQLCQELLESLQDGSLPSPLTPEQVWGAADGRVQLADWALDGTGPDEASASSRPQPHEALELLRQVARLALEGSPAPGASAAAPIQAPLPQHARRFLDRLLGVAQPAFATLAEVHDELERIQDAPSEVDASLRIGQFAVLAAGVIPSLILMFGAGIAIANLLQPATSYAQLVFLALLPSCLIAAFWIVWSMVFHGGLSFGLLGLSLVDKRGRPASPWRCGWRSLVVWGPILLVLLSSALWPLWLDPQQPAAWFEDAWLGCWLGVLSLLLAYAAITLNYPDRSLHDYIAGTYVVPR